MAAAISFGGVGLCVCGAQARGCAVLVPLECTCRGCGSTSVLCAGDGGTEGGSLRRALQPCLHAARGTEGVAARRKAEELCFLCSSGVGLRAVPCLAGGDGCGDYLRATDVDEMASNDPS